jgi:hypothetical protein
MGNYQIKTLIEKHLNYRFILMTEVELRTELKNWSRKDLIEWLTWNDSNGIYNDEQSMSEIGNIMTYNEGVEIMINQIIQKNA